MVLPYFWKLCVMCLVFTSVSPTSILFSRPVSSFTSCDALIPSPAFLLFLVSLNCCPFCPLSPRLWMDHGGSWSCSALPAFGLSAVLPWVPSRVGVVYPQLLHAVGCYWMLLNLRSSGTNLKNQDLLSVFCQVLASLPWTCAVNSISVLEVEPPLIGSWGLPSNSAPPSLSYFSYASQRFLFL